MKRTILFAIIVGCLALVFACATQSNPTEEALRGIYDRYREDLILDGAEKYTVVKGDMLSALSRRFYNNGFYFPVIMLASSDVVVDPDKIEPGMELTIPDLQKNLDDPTARENIKKVLMDIAELEDDRNRKKDAEGLRNLANSL